MPQRCATGRCAIHQVELMRVYFEIGRITQGRPTRWCLLSLVLVLSVLSAACAGLPTGQAAHTAQPRKPGSWSLQQAVDLALQGVSPQTSPWVLLIGELHDNPNHQSFQQSFVHTVAQRFGYGRVAVVFEMLARDDQPRMDAAVAQRRPPAQWPGFVPVSAGWSWPSYAAVIDTALHAGGTVYGGNLTVAQARDVVRQPQAWQQGLSASWAQWQQTQLAQAIERGHCGMMPPALIPSMVLAQRWRDQTMADVLRRLTATHDVVVLIAGAQHVRRDWGVGWLLSQPGEPVDPAGQGIRAAMNLRAIELSEDRQESAEQAQPQSAHVWRDAVAEAGFDVRLMAAKVQRNDPCAAFAPNRQQRR